METTRPASLPGDAADASAAVLATADRVSPSLAPDGTVRREGLLDRSGWSESAAYSLLATIACVVVIRILIFSVGVISYQTASPEDFREYTSGAWMSFDGQWYLKILQEGYPPKDDPSGPNPPPLIAFFPLFPLLGRLLSPVFHPSPALLIIANVSSLIGIGFFYEWSRRLTSARTAFWACLLLATFPTATFFSAALTEGLFMMFAAITLYLLQRQRHFAAALVCGCGSLVRPTGAALAMAVVLWCWVRHLMLVHPELFARGGGSWRAWLGGERWKRMAADALTVIGATLRPLPLGRLALIGAISTAGIAAYQSYLWQRYDDFFVYFKVQTYWQPGGLRTEEGRKRDERLALAQATEVRDLRYYAAKAMKPQAWNRGLMLLFVGLAIYGLAGQTPIRRELFVFPLMIFLMTYVPGWGTRASSVARYETAAVPCFLLLALILLSWRRPAVLGAVLVAQLAVQVYYAYGFSRGIWVG
jgi:hypothetical protein